MSKKPLTDKEGEVRELTAEDFASMQPVENVLPSALLDVIAKAPGPARAAEIADQNPGNAAPGH